MSSSDSSFDEFSDAETLGKFWQRMRHLEENKKTRGKREESAQVQHRPSERQRLWRMHPKGSYVCRGDITVLIIVDRLSMSLFSQGP